ERAHTRPITHERGPVGSGHYGEFRRRLAVAGQRFPGSIVVLEAAATLLQLGQRDIEVEVEVTAVRGRPGKRPAHALPEGVELCEWRPRYRPQHDVVVGQVYGDSIEPVSNRRAGGTAGSDVGPE